MVLEKGAWSLFEFCLSICLKILSCSLGGCVVSTDILLTGFGLVCCVASKSRIKQVQYVFFMDNEQLHGNQSENTGIDL